MVDADEPECERKPRTASEILEAIEEFHDRAWYDRHMLLRERHEAGARLVSPEILKGAEETAEMFRQEYGKDNLGPYSDVDWGMILGKLSALRWVMGADWDELDT